MDRGFLAVYPFETWTDKEMPNYNQGQLIKRFAVSMAEGKTDPPRLMTEADLIAIMDKEGIGTDATHADHIKKVHFYILNDKHRVKYLQIKDRGYVVLTTDNRLQPTSRG